ncbi:MAG: gamma-glutamyl-gamma-aminobutyrate hydrolase family protein [Bradymonadaceae bacterium]|nr:gamma-glutamyl-gamma-aminobutyrate hydrolase family protein [Lujinxingiaceae bacterium]
MSSPERKEGRIPIIGVSACLFHQDAERTTFNGRPLLYLEQSMAEYVMASAALPMMIPVASDPREFSVGLSDAVECIDGLVLQGGVDMSPLSYGQQPLRPEWSGDAVRDAYELELVRLCIAKNKPVLGICRGHQVVNVALGGTLYQDLPTQVPSELCHRHAGNYERNRHEIVITEGSWLQHLYPGVVRALVPSVHHQAIAELGQGLVVQARSVVDDIIEAVRLQSSESFGPYVVGVQWHPEFQHPEDTSLLDRRPIMEDFLRAVRLRRDL